MHMADLEHDGLDVRPTCDCDRLRQRVAELERENAALQKALEEEFRDRIQREFGVTYEQLLADPDRFVVSAEELMRDLQDHLAARQ